jgi:hypothetical protein
MLHSNTLKPSFITTFEESGFQAHPVDSPNTDSGYVQISTLIQRYRTLLMVVFQQCGYVQIDMDMHQDMGLTRIESLKFNLPPRQLQSNHKHSRIRNRDNKYQNFAFSTLRLGG